MPPSDGEVPTSSSAADVDYTVHGTLKVEHPVPAPDVFDILIAGGGPAGTAAAARASELGLSFLVIDYDDLLKRIRDFAKDKPIKPGYGGGDKMPFPPGGPLVTGLHFDVVDKDEMVADWKRKYHRWSLPARIGSELTGLERTADGAWLVRTWNHRAGAHQSYKAKNLLIAIGAGVPRRFDIPGNLDGIAFRLTDPARYVGAPALVIGGGTSAAEAVIAISNAKSKANDETAVYWSYRGDRMPKVSRALGEEFFDAYVGNGNVRYLSFSEPAAVVVGPDKREYLSLRIDRKLIAGRPAETVHLEFPKENVIACIGEEVPFRLLQSLGIKVALVNDRPLILVDHAGETSLPGVFLVGDVRGPRFVRCASFDDASTYEQVVQKRNIKAAMWEAVRAVETIAERLGVEGARMASLVAPGEAPRVQMASSPPPSVTSPARSEPGEVSRPEVRAQLVSLLPDGSEEEQFPIGGERITIGRSNADVSAPEDTYMAERHATVTVRGGQYVLEDTSDGYGVWIRVKGVEGRSLGEGDVVWVGAQMLVAARGAEGWSVAHHDSEGAYRTTHPIGERGLFVGRGSEAKLDPNDMSLSRRHAQFRVEGGVLRVFDLASTNGTYVRISGPVALSSGDEFRLGTKRFRFESLAPVTKLAAGAVVLAAAEAPPAAEIETGAVPVTIEHPAHPVSFGVKPGQDVLHGFFDYLKGRYPEGKLTKAGDPAEHQEEPLSWECKVGLCGLCAVRVLENPENLEPVDPGSPELNTLENKSFLEPDPRRHRLACLTRAKGPVRLGIPE